MKRGWSFIFDWVGFVLYAIILLKLNFSLLALAFCIILSLHILGVISPQGRGALVEVASECWIKPGMIGLF